MTDPMLNPPESSPRVLHLDHTVVEGGAEYALQRMFAAGPEWRAVLLLPPTDDEGVYSDRGSVPLRHTGVRQPAGVSAGGVTLVGATVRLLAQAAATRLHAAFRSADLVDANTARSAAYGALAARLSRKPFVIHLRDMIAPDALGRAGYELMTRVALPRADGVVTDTHATLSSARPFLRSDAVTAVIASASGLQPGVRRKSPTPGPLRIGMLARIDPWKGQAVLLDAFAEAFPDSDAELELAGGAFFGHEAFLRELRNRAEELGIEQRVRFLGHVEDVDSVIGRWDIAVHASTRPEPLGQNVLQYLAAGLVTVVADEGGPTEYVRHDVNGVRVAPGDPALLGAALRRLASDPALRNRLAEAATETPGLLTDVDVVAAHAGFYRRVLTGTRAYYDRVNDPSVRIA